MESHGVMVTDIWVGFSLVLCLMFWHVCLKKNIHVPFFGFIYRGVELLSYKECTQLALVDAAKT